VADTVRVSLDRFVLDPLVSEALEEGVEPNDGEGDPARARPRRARLDEEPGTVIDLPENLVPHATVWASPEEPRVPIDAGFEIGYRDTGVEVRDRAQHAAGLLRLLRQGAGGSRSGRDLDGPDQQVEDPHLGERVAAPRELLLDRSHRRPVAVQVAFVAAYKPERALSERSLGSEVVVL
jgi:hypothetical protein